MKINGTRVKSLHLPAAWIFFTGAALGLVLLVIGRNWFLGEAGPMNEAFLQKIGETEIPRVLLAPDVMTRRMACVLALCLLSVTYLGLAACVVVLFRYGLLAGVFCGVLALRYGFRGLLLLAASLFPQYLFYAPALLLLIGWCEGSYHRARRENEATENGPGLAGALLSPPGRMMQLGLVLLFTLLGCLTEIWVNPPLVQMCLRIF